MISLLTLLFFVTSALSASDVPFSPQEDQLQRLESGAKQPIRSQAMVFLRWRGHQSDLSRQSRRPVE
ncbi:unnamed protein product [Linum trigynum]|uniref:Uncharacterized protein n=1 Tax=Linum trigynum TaxID=586398 RepID=A0AAV2FX31_9ROSI